jgi:hypothetical protein
MFSRTLYFKDVTPSLTLRIFDTQREQWIDLDQLYPEPETRPAPALPKSCPDCGAHFGKGDAAGLREHQRVCASAAHRVRLKDEHGNTVGMLGDPDPAKLARHVQLYGREGAGPWLHLLEQGGGDGGAKAVFSVTRRRSRQSPRRRMVARAGSPNFF